MAFPTDDPDSCAGCVALAADGASSPFLHPADRYFARNEESRRAREGADDLARWNEEQSGRAAPSHT